MVVETLLRTPRLWVGTATSLGGGSSSLALQRGGTLPASSLCLQFASFGDPSLPTVLLCPSMSNTPFPVDTPELGESGWWSRVVGEGAGFGLRLDRFHVLVPSPLGSPFGSTSPLSPRDLGDGEPWGPDFPAVTPADMADAHALLLTELGVERVHAVVGGSMGGMQALQFAVRHPERCGSVAAVAATGRTSPATVALRSVQRAAIRMDPAFAGGRYDPSDVRRSGPVQGMSVARQVGTICYRSRLEFDSRFAWAPLDVDSGADDSAAEPGGGGPTFEVERYLEAQARKFVSSAGTAPYDPNCYLALSECMDLMDMGAGHAGGSGRTRGTRAAAESFGGDVLLLPFSTDVLMPPAESRAVARAFVTTRGGGAAAKRSVHCETLRSTKGHDAFLVSDEAPALCSRLAAFLEGGAPAARAVYERSVRDIDPGM